MPDLWNIQIEATRLPKKQKKQRLSTFPSRTDGSDLFQVSFRMLQMVWILLRNSAERSPINSRRKSFPPFDMAYQGFASADSKRDAKAIRIFLEDENLIGCAQSYAENMGLYGQRVGCMRKYGLEDNTVDFIGHALALHKDDSYLDEPAIDTVKRMKLYAESLARFQGGSPYIYPLYGLAELPPGICSPKCQFDENGKACDVTSEGETAKCKKVVCDPSYLLDKVQKVGKVARAICIMSHPIPNTNDSHSVQVILPHKQLGRKSDMLL
ncbi:hypothetical protein AAC387_Pa08g1131 [Persea americana]